MNFIACDDFLARFTSARVCYLSGKVGSGKTSFAVALSWLLHTSGLVDATITNVPLRWATPVREAPLSRLCILIDELGVFHDARTIQGAGNDFRKRILGFPRKLDSYVIVCSRIVPDKSFRSLSVQRDYRLPGGFQRYVYGEDDGVLAAEGWFWVRGLSDVYGYYDNMYVPSGVAVLADHVARAAAAAMGESEDPNEHFGADGLPLAPVGHDATSQSHIGEVRGEPAAQDGARENSGPGYAMAEPVGLPIGIPVEVYPHRASFADILRGKPASGSVRRLDTD